MWVLGAVFEFTLSINLPLKLLNWFGWRDVGLYIKLKNQSIPMETDCRRLELTETGDEPVGGRVKYIITDFGWFGLRFDLGKTVEPVDVCYNIFIFIFYL